MRDIPGYEGLYQISETGVVVSLERSYTDSMGRTYKVSEKIIKQREFGGELKVTLSKNNTLISYNVQHLIDATYNNIKLYSKKPKKPKKRIPAEIVRQIRSKHDPDLKKLSKEYNIDYMILYHILNNKSYTGEEYY